MGNISVYETTSELELKQSYIISSGLSFCPICHRFIAADVIYEDGYSYLVKKCPYDNRTFKSLIGKGEYFKPITDKMLGYWPRWSFKVGDKYSSDEGIINRKNIPSIIFALSTRCNSTCKICVVKDTKPELNMDVDSIRDKIAQYKNKEITLCGGEPTVREDLPQIIRLIKKSGNYPAIHTNGLKIADEKYLLSLRRKGLRHVYLSFDGFDEEIYRQIRGGAEEYSLKLKALKNLQRLKLWTTLRVTLVNGLNLSQIPKIITYAAQHRFISDIRFMSVLFVGKQQAFGMTRDNLVSKEEFFAEVNKFPGIDTEYLNLWDELKVNISLFIDKYLTSFFRPVFDKGKLYFKRENGKLRPLFTKEQLRRLINDFRKEDTKGIAKDIGIRFLLSILINKFSPNQVERGLLIGRDILKISWQEREATMFVDLFFSFQEPIIIFEYMKPESSIFVAAVT